MNFNTLMDSLTPLLDYWTMTEYKMQQLQAKHDIVPEGLINLKKSIINRVEALIMEHNKPELEKLTNIND